MLCLMIRRASIAMACAAALAVLAGCGGGGGSPDTSSAGAAARAYVESSNQRDFPRLCDVLSDAYKLQLHMGSRCVGFLQEQTSGGGRQSLTLVGVQQSGDQAVASLSGTIRGQNGTGQSQLQLQLQKEGDEWHVTHLGGNVNF
jgi:ketosteroid isomerase-like protein